MLEFLKAPLLVHYDLPGDDICNIAIYADDTAICYYSLLLSTTF